MEPSELDSGLRNDDFRLAEELADLDEGARYDFQSNLHELSDDASAGHISSEQSDEDRADSSDDTLDLSTSDEDHVDSSEDEDISPVDRCREPDIDEACAQIDAELLSMERSHQLTRAKMRLIYQKYLSLVKKSPHHLQVLLGKAYMEGLLGRPDHASNTLLLASSLYPDHPTVSAMLSKLGDFDTLSPEARQQVAVYLTDTYSPTPAFELALRDIFDRFCSKKSHSLGPLELNALYRSLNGTDLSESQLRLLLSGTYHLNPQRRLTFRGFVQFYVRQTVEDPAETGRDLLKLGYDHRLRRL